MRVLVVEDHKELAATIAVGLRREGMAVDIASDGEDALRHAAGDSYVGQLFGLCELGANASRMYAAPLGRDTINANPLGGTSTRYDPSGGT